MKTVETPAEAVADTGSVETRVNDIVIHVATVNGSGSQSSNNTLLRSIFNMGIPVSGKNLFPSNIQGLPTWFTIRANKDGYVARRDGIDLLVCMNPETAHEDLLKVDPGTLVVYDAPLKLDSLRDDVMFFSVPFTKIVTPLVDNSKLRKLVRNMIYVGVVARLIGIEMEAVREALDAQFKSKPKAASLNFTAAEAGYQFAEETLPESAAFRLERLDKTAGKIIIDGNAAAALGCMFAGVSVVTWYPITPSSSLVESLIGYMSKYRVDKKTGKATYAIVQAEDELAALGVVVGAGWAGARAMTATSGPGISLMSEFTGLAYFAEIPGVVFDIQRVGPSTGLPTRTMQGDVLSTALLSHGDTNHVLLFPSSPEEAFTLSGAAFDLAEQLQTIIFVLSDLDLGMNNWMSDPFPYPERPMQRGKVLTAEELEKIEDYGRYKDTDGDGIPYRTIPGTRHPKSPYFTRGTGHDEYARYTEDNVAYEKLLKRLARKFETAREFVPPPAVEKNDDARIGIIAYGTSHWPIIEARDHLTAKHGIETSYLRLRAYPFNQHLLDFIDAHDRLYVIDQNRDAQMLKLMKMELSVERIAKLRSILSFDGWPLSAQHIVTRLTEQENS